jgi:Xaa-Pro aminopeptidase
MAKHASTERIERARRGLASNGADWLLIRPGADFRWLTGGDAHATERLLVLAIPRRGAPFCLVPRLEADALAGACPWLDLEVWADHEDAFERLAARLDLLHGPALLLGEGFRTAWLLRLAAHGRCLPATPVVAPLRAVKDAFELRLLEEAGANADRVIEQAADFMRPGMTEREVAAFVMDRFRTLGDAEPWVIVASGPNSALPHHATSDRALAEGEVVLLDLGAYTGGYGSDITRTFILGTPPPEFQRVYDLVNSARAAAIGASRAGAEPEAVDRAARDIIDRAGYGERFTHRTGHGVGLEVHEPPYIVAGNRAPLEQGHVHSVEPGIYLPGRFGVRLEDLVVVESRAARRLNQAPLDPLPPRLRR